ncbi:unnamed protein product [Meloidogyne enterolobii]|uniref:Uncharacterized protein n=1 Tax=Meloidogyne enterolobii TaxID=390850 RepID=A0ACB0YSQ6_MELEN
MPIIGFFTFILLRLYFLSFSHLPLPLLCSSSSFIFVLLHSPSIFLFILKLPYWHFVDFCCLGILSFLTFCPSGILYRHFFFFFRQPDSLVVLPPFSLF